VSCCMLPAKTPVDKVIAAKNKMGAFMMYLLVG
jgi:hypothetical protein